MKSMRKISDDTPEEVEKLFGAASSPDKKESLAAIERRRQHVWQMTCEGIPESVMAEILKVDPSIIKGDLKALDENHMKYIARLKINPDSIATDLGKTIRKMDGIYEEAITQYASASTAQDKERFLKIAQNALLGRCRVLIDTGFLPKAGIEITQNVQHSLSFKDKYGGDSKLKIMDNPEARRKIMAALDAAGKIDKEKVIDVTVKPVTPDTK